MFSCAEKKEILISVSNAPEKIQSIMNRLGTIEQSIGSNAKNDAGFQEKLLGKISSYCQEQKIILREFPQTHWYEQQDYTVETYTVVLEGSYIKLLKLLNMLESEHYGKITSVKFESQKDYISNITKLTATIYLQNIKNNKKHES